MEMYTSILCSEAVIVTSTNNKVTHFEEVFPNITYGVTAEITVFLWSTPDYWSITAVQKKSYGHDTNLLQSVQVHWDPSEFEIKLD